MNISGLPSERLAQMIRRKQDKQARTYNLDLTKRDDGFDELRSKVYHLSQLLNDPHPGLASWAKLYGSAVNAITEWYKEN